MEKNIEKFMETLSNQSSSTQIAYRNDLINFYKKMRIDSDWPKKKNYLVYLDTLDGQGAKTSINRAVSSLKKFSSFQAMSTSYIHDESMFDKRRRAIDRTQYYVTTEVVKKLIEGILRWSNSASMHASLVGILYDCGFKKNVLLNLKVKDIYFQDGRGFVLIGERTSLIKYDLSLSTTIHLKRYIEEMRSQKRLVNKEHYLLQRVKLTTHCSDNKPLNAKTVNEILEKGCEYAGITKKITPAHIRNTYLHKLKISDLTKSEKNLTSGLCSENGFHLTASRLGVDEYIQ